MPNVKRVYTFGNKQAEGNGKMRELLGGKGANLAEMNLVGIPVPPGFTITTEVCTEYYQHGKDEIIKELLLQHTAFLYTTISLQQSLYLHYNVYSIYSERHYPALFSG